MSILAADRSDQSKRTHPAAGRIKQGIEEIFSQLRRGSERIGKHDQRLLSDQRLFKFPRAG